MTMSLLSVIIPVYNEEKSILKTLNDIKTFTSSIKKEVIVVNDGSTDLTLSILKTNPTLYSKLITLNKNSGKGWAVKIGLLESKGEYILIQDADSEYNPQEIKRMWDYVCKLEIDLLTTTRFTGSQITRVHYFWHKVGNKFITLVFNIRSNTTFTDIYSGYIIFRRNLLEPNSLRFKSWGQQAEILRKIVRVTSNVYETPINYYGRTYAEGKKIRAKNTANVLFAILFTRK